MIYYNFSEMHKVGDIGIYIMPTLSFSVFNNVIFTARKRSLGQGNIFTPVCHSVHRGGGGIQACIAGGIPACLAVGWSALRGRGVCSWGGGGLLPEGAWWRPPGQLLLRAVRILLECILVFFI